MFVARTHIQDAHTHTERSGHSFEFINIAIECKKWGLQVDDVQMNKSNHCMHFTILRPALLREQQQQNKKQEQLAFVCLHFVCRYVLMSAFSKNCI